MNFYKRLKQGIPSTITLPLALKKLCAWVDKNGQPISGYFNLSADDGDTMKYWLDTDALSDRFGIFGTAPDGSLYAFWLDDNQRQRIVHLGSEGDDLYILADNFVDFIRLLAIGYDEIGSADLDLSVKEWNLEIGEPEDEGVNPKFRAWVIKEFGVTIPERGNEIVDVDDTTFSDWLEEKMDLYTGG